MESLKLQNLKLPKFRVSNPTLPDPTHHYLLVYHYTTTNVACVHLLYIVVSLDRYLHELLWLYSSFYCMHKRIIHGYFKYSSSSSRNAECLKKKKKKNSSEWCWSFFNFWVRLKKYFLVVILLISQYYSSFFYKLCNNEVFGIYKGIKGIYGMAS